MTKSFQDMAQRIVNGEENFVESLMTFGKISRDDAFKAMRVMLKLKAAKRHVSMGRIEVTHGAYLAKGAIRNAVKIANGQL